MKKQTRYLIQAALASSILMSPMSYGDVTINTPTNTPLVTSVDGNIIITKNGNVSTVATIPVTIDTPNQTVTADPGNVTPGNGAIGSLTNKAIYIPAAGTGSSATITNGAGTAIGSPANTTIYAEQPNLSVINSGTMVGADRVVYLRSGATNAFVDNRAGAVMLTVSPSPAVITAADTGMILNNAGSIFNDTVLGSGVIVINPFDTIDNSGLILSENGFGINISAIANISGDVTNSGIILLTDSSSLLNAPVYIHGDPGFVYSGTFTNTADGLISTTVTNPAGQPSQALLISDAGFAGFGTFNNEGTIFSSDGNFGVRFLDDVVGATGTFNNSGSISNEGNAAVVVINRSFDEFNNSGIIEVTLNNAIVIANTNPATLKNGFINSGDILALGAGPTYTAIGFPIADIPLIQNDGLILGNVELSLANTGLTMNGGVISGYIISNPAVVNLINLNGGENTGCIGGDCQIQLGPLGDIVALKGARVEAIVGGAGDDTIGLFSGSFTSIDGGGNATDDLITVPSSFTANGTITNVEIIVTSGGPEFVNFTINNTVTNVNTVLGADNNTAIIVNSSVSGTGDVGIDGELQISSTGSVSMDDVLNTGILYLNKKNQLVGAAVDFNLTANTYTQTAPGDFAVEINGPAAFGAILVNDPGISSTLNLGTTISPFVTAGTLITDGSIYPIINNPAGGIIDSSTLIQPDSATIFFTKELNGAFNELDLIAHRRPFSYTVNTEISQQVAPTLDALAQGSGPSDPDLRNLLVQLDVIPSVTQLSQAVEQLAPPLNYAMIEGAHISMDRSFNSILKRLEDLKHVESVWGAEYQVYRNADGINYGGDNEVHWGTWVKPYGEFFEQKKRLNVEGYQGDAVGIAIGADWTAMDTAVLGVALNWTKVHVVGKTTEENLQNLKSVQGTLYGFFEPYDAFYLDTLFGVANTTFNNRRNIGIGNIATSAFSNFKGLQIGAQIDAGYAFLKGDFYTAPVMRLKYTHLQLDNYTENGANGLNLNVDQQSLVEQIAGVGLRVAYKQKYAQTMYVPEAMFMYLYDFAHQGQNTVANFLGGGTAFSTDGIAPGADIYLFDLAINAHSNDGYVCTVKYELEWRDHFMGNSAYLELYHRWS